MHILKLFKLCNALYANIRAGCHAKIWNGFSIFILNHFHVVCKLQGNIKSFYYLLAIRYVLQNKFEKYLGFFPPHLDEN